MTHVTQTEFERLATRQLTGAERKRLLQHVDGCAECRFAAAEATGAELKGRALLDQLSRQDHPTPDEIERFVDHELETEEGWIEDHVEACSRCAAEARTLREMQSAIAPERRHPHAWRIGWISAAVAMLALVTSFIMMREKQSPAVVVTKPQPKLVVPEPKPLEPVEETLIASVEDGDRTIGVTKDRRLRGVTIEDRALEAAAVAFVMDRKLPQPARLGDVVAGEVTLLGAANGSRFMLRSPVATFVAQRRPRFRWNALPNAKSYVVAVFDNEFNEIARSEPLKGSEWQPPIDLPRGRTLRWQVEATLPDGETLTAPRVEDGEAKFAVLNAADAKRIAELEERYGDSKVVLAVAYASVGMREEAERLARELDR